MGITIDSNRLLMLEKDSIPRSSSVSYTDTTTFKSKEVPNVDVVEISSRNLPEEPQEVSNNNSKLKKWLIGIGVTTAAVVLGIGIARFAKKAPIKIHENVEEILSKKGFDTFEDFINLKMCKNLTSQEKEQAWNLLSDKDNKKIFLAALSGNKPMSMLNERKFTSEFTEPTIDILKKLHLGDNFELLEGYSFKTQRMFSWNRLFVNKNALFETIKNNKEIYTTRLGLPKRTPVKEIYKELTKVIHSKQGVLDDDLLGISLGFPRHDSMIFHLEKVSGMDDKARVLADFPEKILAAFKSADSPYKNLSEKQKQAVIESIKRIDYKRLGTMSIFQNYDRRLYNFVNYCDDTVEIERIAKLTEKFLEEFPDVLY